MLRVFSLILSLFPGGEEKQKPLPDICVLKNEESLDYERAENEGMGVVSPVPPFPSDPMVVARDHRPRERSNP